MHVEKRLKNSALLSASRQVGTIVKHLKTSIQLVVKVKASLFRNKEINIQSVKSMQ